MKKAIDIRRCCMCAAALTLLAVSVEAKPLSYPGGAIAMQENDETGHTLSLDYTLSPRYAVGLYAKQESSGKKFYRAWR